nr:hypothetical protein [uncultured Rhodopila sp.]
MSVVAGGTTVRRTRAAGFERNHARFYSDEASNRLHAMAEGIAPRLRQAA